MRYREAMTLLSQCGLGVVLVDEENLILESNSAGDLLLHGEGQLKGKSLQTIVPAFCQKEVSQKYYNVAFGEYLLQCEPPDVEGLPEQTRLVLFRSARNDACHDMLLCIINKINDSLILCDEHERIFLLNDAAVRMDSLLTQDVAGKKLSSVYTDRNGTDLLIPQVMADQKPRVDVRQNYITCYEKNVDIMSDNYPLIRNGRVLGGFSLMKDWSQVDRLYKQIVDLQSKLLKQSTSPSREKQKSKLSAKYQFKDIIYNSVPMRTTIKKGKMIAKSNSSVMIYGETGTGKELFAQSIHNASSRANGPFLAINCAAIPENLLEALLFGTEKGAYTGADSRTGLFQQADGGTLLLDEINSMDMAMQSKLLRVLQDGMVRRVGGVKETHVDVRVLSNINIPPHQAIQEKKIRLDLFYRLGVVNLNIPPLRDRKEDIPLLSKEFIITFNRKLLKNVQHTDSEVLELFLHYNWPGNVRELEHVIEYAMNIIPDNAAIITKDMMPDYILTTMQTDTQSVPVIAQRRFEQPVGNTLRDIETNLLIQKLKENGGNVSQTARVLGISRQCLQYRIKRAHIDVKALMGTQPSEKLW